jgi:hypothetical protein
VGMDRKVEIDGLCCWGLKAGVVAMGDLPGDGSLSVLERTGGVAIVPFRDALGLLLGWAYDGRVTAEGSSQAFDCAGYIGFRERAAWVENGDIVWSSARSPS